MADEETIERLRIAGFEIGANANYGGLMRMLISKDNVTALVAAGDELRELANGSLTLLQIHERRQREKGA